MWFGSKKSSDGNWYGRKSGKRIHHQGSLRSKAWLSTEPKGRGLCGYYSLHTVTTDLNGILYDYGCEITDIDFTLCEIYYASW